MWEHLVIKNISFLDCVILACFSAFGLTHNIIQ
jgi:hypothetical protein